MFHDILFLILGLALIMAGGNYLTDSAESIARRFHISPLVIGLTVVAFGSSMPDLATSAIAAVKRQPGIALGNVVGTCIFNIFFIIGACATCRPLETAISRPSTSACLQLPEPSFSSSDSGRNIKSHAWQEAASWPPTSRTWLT